MRKLLSCVFGIFVLLAGGAFYDRVTVNVYRFTDAEIWNAVTIACLMSVILTIVTLWEKRKK